MAKKGKSTANDWIITRWRPMMGWQYMITCTFDFIVFPIAFALVQSIFNGNVTLQWRPITLEGAGLYHISMGAILGVTAWSRGQEKMVETKLRVANGQVGSDPVVEEEPEPIEEDSDPPMPHTK